ncbi:MAG: hypothetical protein H7293_03435 [Candidatus Saccharibacteria bacterium]|nr:hypothetical protein [Rhodoferax sp.]
MFSSAHEIWKFAFAGDELDDWLPFAEDLVRKWSKQDSREVEFGSTFEIVLASYLLKDDLLPTPAKAAFARVMLEIIDQASSAKLKIKCLHIEPPKPGRKENRAETFIRFREVKDLIQEGTAVSQAYKVVAEKHFKSPETIRRDYERIVKKMSKS